MIEAEDCDAGLDNAVLMARSKNAELRNINVHSTNDCSGVIVTQESSFNWSFVTATGHNETLMAVNSGPEMDLSCSQLWWKHREN